jgi:hypothetical protein
MVSGHHSLVSAASRTSEVSGRGVWGHSPHDRKRERERKDPSKEKSEEGKRERMKWIACLT